jgi:hypothetical protein
MAATAVFASHLDRPARGVRVLALAVTVLLLVDPFLLRSDSTQSAGGEQTVDSGSSTGRCLPVGVCSERGPNDPMPRMWPRR